MKLNDLKFGDKLYRVNREFSSAVFVEEYVTSIKVEQQQMATEPFFKVNINEHLEMVLLKNDEVYSLYTTILVIL